MEAIFAQEEPVVIDLWYIRDRDRVTFTNRAPDLPPWFQLHPTEAQDSLVSDMMRRLESGWKPGEIVDGPNLWRVRAGDRIAWVGESRPQFTADNGLLAIFNFHANALAFGEPPADGELLDAMAFGSLPAGTQAGFVKNIAFVRQTLKILGTPREIAVGDWGLG